jgi:MFS family permease
MTSAMPEADAPLATVETKQSWTVATAALVTLAFSFGGPWIAAVGLTAIAADVGDSRSVPALAGSLAWFGSAVGGVAMGPLAVRFGIRWTVIFGAAMIAIGLAVSTLGGGWPLYVGHGVFMGLLGNAGVNAPLYVYVSRWFDRRRGSALALISSGAYVAGTVWPPLFQRAVAVYGWRQTMLVYAVLEVAMIVPIAVMFFRRPPDPVAVVGSSSHPIHDRTVLGWNRTAVFALLLAAPFLCCVPMAMPQGHLVAYCTDLGLTPARGAAMLSVVLGTAFVTRQLWGWISDRIGGLLTVLAGSTVQAMAMIGFLLTQDEAGLFTVSAFFGLGFSAIIPAYVLAVREFFPAREAGWRVPAVLLCSGTGMAAGGWLAGLLYDSYGFYAPAFATGIAFNLLNLLVVGTLVLRQREHARAG